jgi:lysozyme
VAAHVSRADHAIAMHAVPRTPRLLALLALFSGLAAAAPGCDAGGEPDVDDGEELAEAAAPACDFGPRVKGLDVSYFQGSIDWDTVAADGWKYAIARISHGTSFDDPEFGANWSGIKAAGMIRGAYQYMDASQDIVASANKVVAAVGVLEDGDLPCVIDVEDPDSTLSKTEYQNRIRTWIDIVEEGTGKQPIIYTGRYYWDDNVGSDEFSDHPLWLAAYTNNQDCPSDPTTYGAQWTFWQWTSTGGVPGIPSANVDKNFFRGTEEELVALAGAGTSTGTYGATLASVDAPATVLAGEAFDVTVTYTNSGSAVWDAATFLGTSEPRDRASVFADASWPSDHRAAVVTGEVAAGAEHAFTFTLRAPDAPGAYVEHFALVQEAVTWFADAGGPADDAVRIAIQVLDDGGSPSTGSGEGGSTSAGGEGGSTGEDDDDSAAAGIFGSGGGASDGEDDDDGGGDGNDGEDALDGEEGCSAAAAPASRPRGGAAALLVGALALAARARRRRGG